MPNLCEAFRVRVWAAAAVGMALSGSGTAFQAVFRNPLVSPGLLWVLAGASLGVAMLFNGSMFEVQVCALVVGLLAVGSPWCSAMDRW
ncbi:MAG TPA: iron chelate uptake ABC transporter family permease subunit [Paenirhodobacter sp.]